MNLIEQIYSVFNGFKDDGCDLIDSRNRSLESSLVDHVKNEKELELIRSHSPIDLPDDYCEIFREFCGCAIEDRRNNYVIPIMTFWTWEEINEFIESEAEDFFEECPNSLPFGDDEGDMFYFFIKERGKFGVYIAEKGGDPEAESRHKIANSLTEVFTNSKIQRKFRDYYEYGDE